MNHCKCDDHRLISTSVVTTNNRASTVKVKQEELYIKIYQHTCIMHIYTKISYIYYLPICIYISIYLSICYKK